MSGPGSDVGPVPAAALDQFSAACAGAVRELGDDPGTPGVDVVGVRPSVLASPADTEAVAACLRVAAEHRLAVVPTGTGSKLTWGAAPRRCDLLLDLSRLDEVHEHGVGEFVVIAGAGLRLSALAERLDGTGQRLALDPARDGTLGGVVATGDAGPLRLSHGAPRDLVIGATLVRADGVIAKSGGKVVKNVAGYDLGKLLTGSYGTLAVLTRLAFRLHPIPPARRFVEVATGPGTEVTRLSQALVHSPLAPTALEYTGDGSSGSLAVSFEGVAAGAQGCAEAAAALMGDRAVIRDDPPSWWREDPTARGLTLVKATYPIAHLGALLDALARAGEPLGVAPLVRASPGVGTALIGLPGSRAADPAAAVTLLASVRAVSSTYGGSAVLLDGPPEAKATVDPWGPVGGLDLMRAVKDRFDPDGILAPGRFVGGI